MQSRHSNAEAPQQISRLWLRRSSSLVFATPETDARWCGGRQKPSPHLELVLTSQQRCLDRVALQRCRCSAVSAPACALGVREQPDGQVTGVQSRRRDTSAAPLLRRQGSYSQSLIEPALFLIASPAPPPPPPLPQPKPPNPHFSACHWTLDDVARKKTSGTLRLLFEHASIVSQGRWAGCTFWI